MFCCLLFGFAAQAMATCPASPPNLTSPANGSTVAFGSMWLNWDPVADAAGYEVWLGLDGDPLGPFGETPFTQMQIDVEPGRTVEWKVVAKAPLCTPLASAHFTFTTKCPNDVPNLLNPPNSTVFPVGSEITFGWNGVPGAAGYDFKVSPAGQNQWTVVAADLTQNLYTGTFTQEGSWDWEVRANFNGACDPAYSETRTFTISNNACQNSAPTLVSPVNNTTATTPVQFEWTDVGAELYRLYVKQPSDAEPKLVTTTVRTQHAESLAAGAYFWGVVAMFKDCPELLSETRALTVEESDSGCPTNPGKATLVSPAPDANNLVSPVAFDWDPVPNASGYRLIASFGGDDAITLGFTQSSELTVQVPAGKGFWLVQTFFGEDCPTTLSERRTLTVTTGAQCTTAPPQALSPPNGATEVDSPVEFRWSEIAGAEKYLLFAAPGNDEFSFYGETEETKLTRFVPPGTSIRWFVIAVLPACPELRSSVSTFQTASDGCPDASIQVNTPAEGASVSSPVSVSWSSVAGAVAYRVWVSSNDSAPVALLRTQSTQASISLPAGAIALYVEALRDKCKSIVSDERKFTVTSRTDCANNQAPTLVSPLGGPDTPTRVTKPVTLAWNAVPNAIAYRVWVGQNGRAYQDVKLTNGTSVTLDLDSGTWGWFVQALFDGCEPKASQKGFFAFDPMVRCDNAAPVIQSPVEGQVVDANVTISWNRVEGASKYRVFASRDGGAPGLLGVTVDTSMFRTLPPGSYSVAVEAVFSECPSTVSQRVSFSVPESQNCNNVAAELVSPPNNATDIEPEIEFSWLPVSGAVKYVLVVRYKDGAWVPIASTVDTRVTRTLPPGHVDWSIITFFAGCDPVEAPHFELDVKRPPDNCSPRSPILVLPDGRFDVYSPVRFLWIGVPDATGYNVWAWQQDQQASIVATTTGATEVSVDLAPGSYHAYVEATLANCAPRESADVEFTVAAAPACGTPGTPIAQVIGQAQSNTSYRLRWTPLPNVGLYEIEESTSEDFENAERFTTDLTSMLFTKDNTTSAPVKYFYRVRGVSSCNDERGKYSDPVGVLIVPLKTSNATVEIGSTAGIVQKVFLPGGSAPQQFSVTSDKPWITITPSSGTLPPEGITLTVTADPRALAIGTNTGTLSVQYTSSSNGVQTHATTAAIPLSVSLVTPVTPSGKGTPPPDSLIFPVVGHAAGANDSLFESDIRVTNLGAQTMKYQLNFTPSGVDGTQTGSSSTIEIEPNQTMAVDDIVASFFGTGSTSITGMLELRPLTTTSSSSSSLFASVSSTAIKQLTTAASSRTYNFTPNGTFGQFIPAIRFDQFVGKALSGGAPTILSLQQVAQSAAYRANFGFAEASGQAADLQVRVYDIANTLLATIPVSLQAGEHKQINGMLASNGINDLADGRVEVEVVNGNGKVTAYVSEVDNLTNDPLLVSAVPKGAVTSNRYVVPGVAYINTGFAFWVTDLRIFNGGSTSTPATLTFYPQGSPGAAVTRDITLEAGEIEVLDNVIGGLFAQPNGAGGAIAITTPSTTTLTATARTYNQTSNGTYGQFIPGVTPAESIGLGDRALQIPQMEQSSRFRANIGLSETLGQAVTVEVSAIIPDSLTTPVVTISLAANEFRQISLADFNLGEAAYNVRVAVKVISGTGRVTAYGSAIDLITQDPTYVPAL